MSKRIFRVLIWVSFPVFLQAQSPQLVSFSEVLETYRTDSLYQQFNTTKAWAEEQSWQGSRLREWEFRTETNDFDWDKQEFMLRLSPRGLKESGFRADRQRLRTQALSSNLQERQGFVLRDRYQTILQLCFAKKSLTAKQAYHKLLQEKIRLLAFQFGDISLDPVDLAKAETDLFEAESDIEQLLTQMGGYQMDLQNWLSRTDSILLPADQLVSVEGIQRIVNRFDQVESTYLPQVQLAAQEVEDQFLQWQIERVRDNRWLDFVQARVQGDNMGFLQPDFSIGIGFVLPLPKENRNQNAINELQWRVAKSQLQQVRAESDLQAIIASSKLRKLLQRYNSLQSRIASGLTQQTLVRVRQQEAPQPLTLVMLEEQLLLQQQILLELEQSLFGVYLDWLDAHGHLSANAPRNFLTEELELLGRE